MTAFPPLADRPDDADAIFDDIDQASPAVLDVLSVASERGLNLDEYRQLAGLCISVINKELYEMIEQGVGTDVSNPYPLIECATLLGGLKIAEEIINSIDLSEDEEAGEDD